jgi:hypothetical protein
MGRGVATAEETQLTRKSMEGRMEIGTAVFILGVLGLLVYSRGFRVFVYNAIFLGSVAVAIFTNDPDIRKATIIIAGLMLVFSVLSFWSRLFFAIWRDNLEEQGKRQRERNAKASEALKELLQDDDPPDQNDTVRPLRAQRW